MTSLDIEQIFAAAVANAVGDAKRLTTVGFEQGVSDQVACAVAELWERGRAKGMTTGEIQAIADRHVEYVDDEPWPRPLPENVVPMHR